MLTAFSHVMMYVNDLDRAAKWYQSVLGFRVKFLASPHYGSLMHDGMKFRLDLHPDPGAAINALARLVGRNQERGA